MTSALTAIMPVIGASEGPDDADPKWIDIKTISDLLGQKTDVQVEVQKC